MPETQMYRMLREKIIELAHDQGEVAFDAALHLMKMGAGVALVAAAARVQGTDEEIVLLQTANDITRPEP